MCLNHWKKNTHIKAEFSTQQMYFLNTQVEWRLFQTCPLKEFTPADHHYKESPSSRRKMIPEETFDLYKGMKETGNKNYMGKCKHFFLIILVYLKDN